MEQLIKELGQVKQKIRRLEKRLITHGTELARLKTRRAELEEKIKSKPTISSNLTKTIVDVINQSKVPLTPNEILAKVEGSGFDFSRVKDPYTMVFATCARLAKRGDINSGTKNGKRTFEVK